jgi:DNA-binding MarR family transcriptional regulator
MRIEEEIKQSRFKNANEKAVINILYTNNWLNHQLYRFYGLYDISSQQFNVLRILRGLNDKPASISLLNERMLDKMSNVSRLVDKLIAKGLVIRQVCETDRRQVDVVITQKGLTIVHEISVKLDVEIQKLVNINEEEAETLSNLLDKLRS